MKNLSNQILELEDGKNYFVVRQAIYHGKTYYFVAGVTEDEEEFTNEFLFLEREDDEDGGFSVHEVTDPDLIQILAKNIKIDV